MKKPNRKQLILIAILLIVFAAIKGSMIYWYFQQQTTSPAITAVSCPNLQQGCQLPDGSTLRFATPAKQQTPFLITLSNHQGKAPSAEFSMENMDMGFNRYRFVSQNGQHQANITLPFCITGSHDWLLDLHTDKQVYRVAFKAQ